jgi:hypothetical protein
MLIYCHSKVHFNRFNFLLLFTEDEKYNFTELIKIPKKNWTFPCSRAKYLKPVKTVLVLMKTTANILSLEYKGP